MKKCYLSTENDVDGNDNDDDIDNNNNNNNNNNNDNNTDVCIRRTLLAVKLNHRC